MAVQTQRSWQHRLAFCIVASFANMSLANARCIELPRLFANGSVCHDSNPAASGGMGGEAPLKISRAASVNAVARLYHLYLPSDYDGKTALPLVVALHGSAGFQSNVPLWAMNVRDHWADYAELNDFIVLAPQAGGSSGGWLPGQARDYAVIVAAINDALAVYNIDRSRLYLWGYSSGGHIAHDLILWEGAWLDANAIRFAAYGTNAGVLRAVAGASAPAQSPRKVPYFAQIGLQDPLLPDSRNDRVAFTNNGWVPNTNFNYLEFNGGHYYDAINGADPAAMWVFLSRFSGLPPLTIGGAQSAPINP